MRSRLRILKAKTPHQFFVSSPCKLYLVSVLRDSLSIVHESKHESYTLHLSGFDARHDTRKGGVMLNMTESLLSPPLSLATRPEDALPLAPRSSSRHVALLRRPYAQATVTPRSHSLLARVEI
jgi:hypothetical protein